MLLRLKEDHDGAEPAASSVSALNLLTIARLTGDAEALSKVERTLARLGPRVGAAARAVPMMLCVLSTWHTAATQIVVVGPRDAEGTRRLERTVAARYLPFAIHIPVAPGPAQDQLSRRLPFVTGMKAAAQGAAVYVCRDFACRQPTSSPDELDAELAGTPRVR